MRIHNTGLTESPLMTLDDSLLISEIMDSIRQQVGVKYAQDQWILLWLQKLENDEIGKNYIT